MATLSATDIQQILDSPQTVTKENVRALISELPPEYRTALEESGLDRITRELNSGIDTEAKKNYLTVFQYQHLQEVEEKRNQQIVLLNLIMNAKAVRRHIDQEIKSNQDPSLLIGLEQDKQIAENLLAELIKEQQKHALLLKLSDAIVRESVLLQKRADLEERRIDEFLKDNPELNKATPELSRKAALERINQFDKEYQAAKEYQATNAAGQIKALGAQIKALGKLFQNDAEQAMQLENQADLAKNKVNSLEQRSSISYAPTLQPSRVIKNINNFEKLKLIEKDLTGNQKNINDFTQSLNKLGKPYSLPTFAPQTWMADKIENTEELNIKNHGNSRKFSPAPQRH